MDKYEYIVNLAEKTAKRVSQNRESWMKFLTSAARIYKYPFKEQLLIYYFGYSEQKRQLYKKVVDYMIDVSK